MANLPGSLGIANPLLASGVATAEAAIGTALGDLLGTRDIPGKVEETVGKLRQFANERIDSLLNGAVSMARETEAFAKEVFDGARSTIELEAHESGKRVRKILAGLEAITGESSEILESAAKIKRRTLSRREFIRKHKARIKDRLSSKGRETSEHLHDFLIGLENEFDLDIQDAQALADKVEQDSLVLYNRTVADARRYSDKLRGQTEQNFQRFKRLKYSLGEGESDSRKWASDQVSKVGAFASARSRSVASIRSPASAHAWAHESIQGAADLAADIGQDAARKPGEVRSYVNSTIDEARGLAAGIEDELLTARDWARTQKGSNAAWKVAMRTHRSEAIEFLAAQGSKIATRLGEQEATGIFDGVREDEDLSDSGGLPAHEVLAEESREMHPDLPDPPESRFDVEIDHRNLRPPEVFPVKEKPQELPEPTVKTKPVSKLREAERPARERSKASTAKQNDIVRPTSGRTEDDFQPAAARVDTKPAPPAKESQPPKPAMDGSSPPEVSKRQKHDDLFQPPKVKVEIDPPAEKKSERTGSGPKSVIHVAPSRNQNPPKTVEKLVNPAQTVTNKKPAAHAISPPSPAAPSVPPASTVPPSAVQGMAPKLSVPSPTSTAISSFQTGPVGNETLSLPDDGGSPVSIGSAQPEEEQAASLRAQLLAQSGPGIEPKLSIQSKLTPFLGEIPAEARFHTGPVAVKAAAALGAEAFTIGRDVFFGAGKFDPDSPAGLGLIGHELTHVSQQMGSRSKMQFLTKSGGDALEQEAQAVGERISANLRRDGLRVGQFIRTYIPEDDQAIAPGVETLLDRLGNEALDEAVRVLQPRLTGASHTIDEVLIDLSIDVEALTEAEIVALWAEAIIDAVQREAPTLAQPIRRTVQARPKFAVQRKYSAVLGAGDMKNAALNFADARSGIPRLESDEKEIVRSLNARTDLDKLKIDKNDPQYQAVLSSHGIESDAEYARRKAKLIEFFTKKGLETTQKILDSNVAVIDQEIMHYIRKDRPGPNAVIYDLIAAAQELMQLYSDFETEYSYRTHQENMYLYSRSSRRNYPKLTTKNMLQASSILKDTNFSKDSLDALIPKWQRWSFRRAQLGRKFPILLGTLDMEKIALPSSVDDLLNKFLDHLWAIKYDILKVKDKLDSDKFWELGEMVATTKHSLHIQRGEGADRILKEYAKDKAEDKAAWEMIKAGIAVALSIAATIATGGLALGFAAGAFAMGAASAYNSLDDYNFQVAANNTAIEEAKRISHTNPSLFWVVMDFVGAGLDFLDVAKAFHALSEASKAARAEAKLAKEEGKAIQKLHDEAVATYEKYKDFTQLSQEEFVARIFRSANLGVRGAESITAQAKVIAELLHGTSRRAAGVYRGDPTVMKQLLVEHGNWKGLSNALHEAGPEGQALLAKLDQVRQEIIERCGAVGMKPLQGAGVGPLSDLDFSSFADEFGTAGEKILKMEADLTKEFGADFSKVLDINFYTEGGMLLSYEKALEHVSASQKTAMTLRVSKRADMLNMMRQLEHAGNDADALKRFKDLLANSSMRNMDIEKFREMAAKLRAVSREDRLKEIDKLAAELKTLTPGSRRHTIVSETITMKQMELNYLLPGAYIGPANLKAPATFADAHQIAKSQLEMIEHAIEMYDHNVLRAVRNYEFHKYASRFADAARKAGFSNKALEDFAAMSELIYKDKSMRSVLDFTGQYPSGSQISALLPNEIDANFIHKKYQEWQKIVNETMPKMEAAMRSNPIGPLPGAGKGGSGAPGPGSPPSPGSPPGSGSPPGGGPSVAHSDAAQTPLPTRQQKKAAAKLSIPEGSDAGVYKWKEVQAILQQSEEGRKALEIQKKYGVVLKDRSTMKPTSGKSYFDPDVGKGGEVGIAPGKNSQEAALIYVHEMGHAERYHQGLSAFNDAAILTEPNAEKWLRKLADEEIEAEIRSINFQFQLEPAGFSASSPLAQQYLQKYMERLAELQTRNPKAPVEGLQAQARQTAASHLKKMLHDGKIQSSADGNPAMRDMYLIHYHRVRKAAGL